MYNKDIVRVCLPFSQSIKHTFSACRAVHVHACIKLWFLKSCHCFNRLVQSGCLSPTNAVSVNRQLLGHQFSKRACPSVLRIPGVRVCDLLLRTSCVHLV